MELQIYLQRIVCSQISITVLSSRNATWMWWCKLNYLPVPPTSLCILKDDLSSSSRSKKMCGYVTRN
jgi:hypothetical protein